MNNFWRNINHSRYLSNLIHFFPEIFVHAALVFLFILHKQRVSGSVKNKQDEKLIFIQNLITCVPYCEWKCNEIINRWRRKCFPNFQISSIMQWRRYVKLINFIPTPCFVLVLKPIKTDDMIASCFLFNVSKKNHSGNYVICLTIPNFTILNYPLCI